ncbi:MAG: hydrolase/acyltransferase [Paenibacillus sp. RIFOXYA1_FULL_44_5]|nr:MAG: hydrolase/acyltransferase [Paenibacillus sp. RIFOXYA1_FULL_44_5]
MPLFKYLILQAAEQFRFVQMPATHMYQLTALIHRLHKEISKLTADHIPHLPEAVGECEALELTDHRFAILSGLDYLNELEQNFSAVQEKQYPLISLLTEIRALQAQMEQWYEEFEEDNQA